jgi:hypothetical protein
VSDKAIAWFRKWALEGDTATLRTNSLSVIAKLPGQENADLVVQVLENDPKVRRLIVASEISRLTQLDWKIALSVHLPADPDGLRPRPLRHDLAGGLRASRSTGERDSADYAWSRPLGAATLGTSRGDLSLTVKQSPRFALCQYTQRVSGRDLASDRLGFARLCSSAGEA